MLITLDQLKTSLQAMKNYVIGLVPTKVSELQNDSGYLTTETDPTVPSWAKAQTKPSYTADEVGAASVNIVADDYDSSSRYVVGDMVIYDGLLYQCICQIDSESWNPAHWRQVTVDDEIKQSNKKIGYNKITAESAYLHKSENGSIVHIMDGAGSVPLQNVSVNISPIQSGGGDPSSSNIRPIYGWDGTRVYSSIVPPINFIPLNDSSWESNGVTLKYLGNGTYEVGEIQQDTTAIFNINIEPFTLSSDHDLFLFNSTIRHAVGQWDFVFSLRDSEGNNKGAFQTEYNEDFNDFIVTFSPGSLINTEITRIRFVISSSISGARFTPMFLSKNYVSYIEWGNIAGLVYGGNMDFTTGVLTSRWACIDSYNGEELPGEWISDRDVYVSGTTPTIGAQVIYRLAQSQTYKLEVKYPARTTYLENYIWALTGNISFSYAIDQQTSFDAKMPNVTFGAKTTLVDTTTLSFSKDGDNDWYCTAENPIQGFVKTDFLYDAVYKVTWDGVEYDALFVQEHENIEIDANTGKPSNYYDWRCIGSASVLGYHDYYETNAPFCVAYDFHRNEAEIQIFTLSTEASHTIKIERIPYTKKLTPIQYYTNTIRGRSPITWGSGTYAVVEGEGSIASGDAAHSEGGGTIASGHYGAHAEGFITKATGNYGDHAEGFGSVASGGYGSHAEGYQTVSSGGASHSEGYQTLSSNAESHAEGYQTQATGIYGAHAEGAGTVASGTASHSEGMQTTASGGASHASGNHTIANHRVQYAFGEYNIADPSDANQNQRGNYIEIVGNGTADDARSNARTLDWDGNEVLAGKLTVGAAPTNNMDVATKQYVDNSQIDVQINGTSISNNGVANIPVAGVNTLGVAKVNQDYGIMLYNNILAISAPADIRIKTGGDLVAPIVAAKQHMSTFYGLAKAAGDITQITSDNAVGTYTSEAKSAIQSMLGISDGYVTKQSIENAGITAKSYTTVFDGEFTVTTVATTGYDNPYARVSATGRLLKDYSYKVTINGTEYILPVKLFYDQVGNQTEHGHNVYIYEYIGNISLYVNDTSTIIDDIINVPFVIMTNRNQSNSIDVITENAGTYNILIEKITINQNPLPYSLIYGTSYYPINIKKTNSNLDPFSIGINEISQNVNGSYAIGIGNRINNNYSIAIGAINLVSGTLSGAMGRDNTVSGNYAYAVGNETTASGNSSFSSGEETTASGRASHSEGGSTTASGDQSHAEGFNTIASLDAAHAEGLNTTASGPYSHAEGNGSTSSGNTAHAEGKSTIASGTYSHAEGRLTQATANCSHAEGYLTRATIGYAHAEGYSTQATNFCAHAEGTGTIASGAFSHVNGQYNKADSYTEWDEWTANTQYSVGDKCKVTTISNGITTVNGYVCKTANTDSTFISDHWTNLNGQMNYANITGNGTANNPSNAYALDWSGNGYFGGNIYVNCDSSSANGTRLPHDIQINSTSIVSNGVANIPVAAADAYGVVKVNSSSGIQFDSEGALTIKRAVDAYDIKRSNDGYRFIPIYSQHIGVFYGLAKAAGDTTQSQSDNAVGTYTEEAKTAIKTMIDVPDKSYDLNLGTAVLTSASLNSYTTSGTYNVDSTIMASITNAPTTTSPYKLIVELVDDSVVRQIAITPSDIYQRTGSSSNSVWTFNDWAKDITSTDYATSSIAGVIKINGNGLQLYEGTLATYPATANDIKVADATYRPITPIRQHNSVFYGLAKAAGDTTQASSANAVGTYTTEAKAAIRSMIGAIGNTDYATQSTGGVVKIIDNGSGGFQIDQGYLLILPASSNQIKTGSASTLSPIVPGTQDYATFYGLAKAAGDNTQSVSNNAVGTYTTEAQTAIKTMLGIADTPPEIFVGSTTPSGYTVYIDPDGGITSGEEVGF